MPTPIPERIATRLDADADRADAGTRSAYCCARRRLRAIAAPAVKSGDLGISDAATARAYRRGVFRWHLTTRNPAASPKRPPRMWLAGLQRARGPVGFVSIACSIWWIS